MEVLKSFFRQANLIHSFAQLILENKENVVFENRLAAAHRFGVSPGACSLTLCTMLSVVEKASKILDTFTDHREKSSKEE